MPKTKPKKKLTLTSLQERVEALEKDVSSMKQDALVFGEELTIMKVSLRHVDERTRRGESILLMLQGQTLKISRTLDRMASAQGIELEPQPSTPEATEKE